MNIYTWGGLNGMQRKRCRGRVITVRPIPTVAQEKEWAKRRAIRGAERVLRELAERDGR